MTRDAEHDGQREVLDEGIQAGFQSEGNVLVSGWFLVAEVREADGSSYLAYRSGDVNGLGLKSWMALGFLHSATNVVEDNAREMYQPPDDDG